jgi:hypothetical protein
MSLSAFFDRQKLAKDNGGPVYKFRTFNAEKDVDPRWQGYLASILRDGLIYIPTPREFNDPWETRCGFLAPDPDTDPEGVERFKEQYLALATSAEHRAKLLAGLDAHGYAAILRALQDELTEAMSRTGLFCVAGNCTQPLMWSYYANGHSGYCIEFNEKRAPFAHAIGVRYNEAYPLIDWTKGGDAEATDKAALRKAKFWEHENEYRIVVPAKPSPVFPTIEHNGHGGSKPRGRYLKIDPDTVTGIVFGVGTTTPDIVSLIDTAEKMGRKLIYRQAGIARTAYELRLGRLSDENIDEARKLVGSANSRS